jgi:hypothetical protein
MITDSPTNTTRRPTVPAAEEILGSYRPGSRIRVSQSTIWAATRTSFRRRVWRTGRARAR